MFTTNGISAMPPIGSICAFLGSSDPDGWIIMNGSGRANSNNKFNALAGMGIGGISGSTYTPPDYKGAFLRGNGSNGTWESSGLGTSQADKFKTHNHGITDNGHSHQSTFTYEKYNIDGDSNKTGGDGQSEGSNQINSATTGITINNTGGTETNPYNYSVNWIIKY